MKPLMGREVVFLGIYGDIAQISHTHRQNKSFLQNVALSPAIFPGHILPVARLAILASPYPFPIIPCSQSEPKLQSFIPSLIKSAAFSPIPYTIVYAVRYSERV
jgi:hypothetical protein